MKRVWLILICVVGLVLSLACGGTGGGGGGIDCPDGLEPHRASADFHGYTFDTDPGDMGDDGMSINFDGQIRAVNHSDANLEHCGNVVHGGGAPNHRHRLCTADGTVSFWWDGDPSWVCVAYYEEAPW